MSRGCCGKRQRHSLPRYRTPTARNNPHPKREDNPMSALADGDFLMCRYMHPNRGCHSVVGPTVFDQPFPGRQMRRVKNGYAFYYGQRAGGGTETFLVHRADAEMQPGWFKPIEDVVSGLVDLPKRKAPVPPVPERIKLGMRAAVEAPPPPQTATDEVETLLKAKAERPFDPQLIPGVGKKAARLMVETGIQSEADLMALGSEGLQKFDGVGKTKAQLIMDYLAEKQQE